MNYSETIEYLYSRLPAFHQIGSAAYKPGLENSLKMMSHLGNPQNRYRTIHVAGTNGKGSVSHFITAVLQSAGYKAGLYTSPHLVDFRERIRVNGEKISEDYVVDFVATNQNYFDDIQPSFFETTMAMAFKYFADCEVDVAVIETGLGGRLDSTNIIFPELAVITNIGFDHIEFLGDTLEKIALEKAGIIKPETPVVIGEATVETKPVFIQKAEAEKAMLMFSQEKHSLDFLEYRDEKMIVSHPELKEIKVGLSGSYQLKNLITVLACIDELNKLGFAISEENLRAGLENVVELTGLRGRWQTLQYHPRVILDTGHNVDAVKYIAGQLKQQQFNKLHIVFGMVNDKDISGVLELLPTDAVYYFAAARTKRALKPEELRKKATAYGLKGAAFDSVETAVKQALQTAQQEDLIFIGGSNFIAGEALPMFPA